MNTLELKVTLKNWADNGIEPSPMNGIAFYSAQNALIAQESDKTEGTVRTLSYYLPGWRFGNIPDDGFVESSHVIQPEGCCQYCGSDEFLEDGWTCGHCGAV